MRVYNISEHHPCSSNYISRTCECMCECTWVIVGGKVFQNYWSFVRGIHRSPIIPPADPLYKCFFLLWSWTSCWARNRVRGESPLTLMWHHCNCQSVVLIWLFSIIRRALQFSIVNQVCVANNSIACLFKISCWPRPLGGDANCLPEITNGLLGSWGQWG